MLRRLIFSPRPHSLPLTLPCAKLQLKRHLFSSTHKSAYVRFGESSQPRRSQNNLYDFRTWDSRIQIAAVLTAGGAIYYISHLEQVPETGRWRFMNTSPESEAAFGELLRKQMLQELRHATLPPDHPLSRHVRRVVTQILHASNLGCIRGEQKPSLLSPFGLSVDPEGNSWNPDTDVGAARNPGASYGPTKEWEVIVVNDMKMINAMASPGLIVVFTGILPVCQDEEGLAAVLGHEIGHVVARHTAERMSSSTVLLVVAAVLHLLGVDFGLSKLASQLVLELPNSRKQELEADLIGLRLISRACYDPQASPQMFARLAKVEEKFGGNINLDLFRTHPSSENRVKYLEERLQEAYSILDSNPDCVNVRRQLGDFRRSARELKFTNSGFELV